MSDPFQSPFPPNEHRTLPRGSIAVNVYENEYSSIIAYTLASPDYAGACFAANQPNTHIAWQSFCSKLKAGRCPPHSPRCAVPHAVRKSHVRLQPAASRTAPEAASPPPTQDMSFLHFKYQFSDKTTTFYCQVAGCWACCGRHAAQVFFAEQFRALRSKYSLPEGEEDFIRALARCQSTMQGRRLTGVQLRQVGGERRQVRL